jgi:phage tail sheath protein FI
MPEYLSPGVYVEEVDAGPKPIEGVSTSTAGAVGVTARGPDTGKPILVTSFAEYMRKFGGPITVDEATKARWRDDPEKGEFWTFPLAVKGFFDNGGQRLYVRRVTAKDAKGSNAVLGQGVMAVIAANALDNTNTLKLDSLIGIQKGTALKVSADGNVQAVTVDSYDTASSTVTISPVLARRVQAGRDFVEIATKKGESFKVTAKSVGEWGNVISARARAMEAAALALLSEPGQTAATTTVKTDVVGDDKFDVVSATGFSNPDVVLVDGKQYAVAVAGTTFTVQLPAVNESWQANWVVCLGANTGGTPNTTITTNATGDTFEVADDTGFANGNTINVNGVMYRLKTKTATTAPKATFKVEKILPWKKGWSVMRVRAGGTVASANPTLFVWGASALYKNAYVEIEDPAAGKKYYATVDTITGNKVDFTIRPTPNPLPNFKVFEGQRIRLIEARLDVLYAPKDGPVTTEEILNLRVTEAEPNDPMFFSNRVTARSQFVRAELAAVVTPPALPTNAINEFPLAVDSPSAATPVAQTWAKLTGGDDNLAALDPDAFVGVDLGPGKRTGIQALEDIDDISITTVPSIWSSLVHNALIQQAETLKYRFAIIDPRPAKPTDDDVVAKIRAFREGFDTKYAALYFPRIQVRDPFTSTTVGLGPSGHMAGLYARVDVERGVHKAPANEVIRGIDTANGFHGLELEITKREQDLLNPKGINALRFFPNRNTRVWGARTLSSDGSWKYINVRRIFIFVERSIDEGTQWVVFEPNDEKTWARVRQTIANFLTTVWRSGALFGTKAEEAFFVRCDRTTMTQDDIDNGRLICVIGIAPVKPAEFVIFRIQQKLIDQKEP